MPKYVNACVRCLFIAMIWLGGSPANAQVKLAAEPKGLSVDDLIAGAESRGQRLATSWWQISEEEMAFEPLGPVARTRAIEVVYAPEQRLHSMYTEVRADKDGRPRSSSFTSAWDGRRLMTLKDEPWRSSDRRWGGLIAADRGVIVGTFPWRTFTENATLCTDQPLPGLLHRAKWEAIGKRTICGFQAWGLRNAGAIKDLEGASVELWLLPDHDFVLVEFTVDYDSPKGAYQKIRDVEIQLYGDIWVMRKAKFSVVNPLMPHGFAAGNLRSYTLKAFSTRVPADRLGFSLAFPVGTGVFDDIGKTSFIAGKAVEVRLPDGTHGYAPIAEFPEYKAMTDYTSGLTSEQWQQSDRSRTVETLMLVRPVAASRPVKESVAPAVGSRRGQWTLVLLVAGILGLLAKKFKGAWIKSRPL